MPLLDDVFYDSSKMYLSIKMSFSIDMFQSAFFRMAAF